MSILAYFSSSIALCPKNEEINVVEHLDFWLAFNVKANCRVWILSELSLLC